MDFGALRPYIDAFSRTSSRRGAGRGAAEMKAALAMASMLLASGISMAEVLNFDADKVGSAPAGWTCGVTGSGKPRWTVEPDASAPSASNVLVQSGAGAFPWCIRTGTAIQDGFVEVKFKPMRGREDQAGGVVWRWSSRPRHRLELHLDEAMLDRGAGSDAPGERARRIGHSISRQTSAPRQRGLAAGGRTAHLVGVEVQHLGRRCPSRASSTIASAPSFRQRRDPRDNVGCTLKKHRCTWP